MQIYYNFKKLYTALFALFGITMWVKASTVDDIKPITATYVMTFDNHTANGTASVAAKALMGDYFLSVTGNSNATNKGEIDIADASTYTAINGADVNALSSTYTVYGKHYNSLRLKNNQNVIALKPLTGSTIYVFGYGNNKTGVEARIPCFATDASLTSTLNNAPTADNPKTGNYVYKFEVPEGFDGSQTLYIGSYNGDAFFSFIIVEIEVHNLFNVSITNTPTVGGDIVVQQTKVDESTEQVKATAYPNGGYAFKEWQNTKGETLSTDNPYTFNITADTEIIALYESTAISVSETESTVLPKDVYEVTGCVTKGDNQLIDSSHDGDYLKFDIIPTVAGKYSFTSMIGTKSDGVAVTLGYLDEAGNCVESEKKEVRNSGNWNSGDNYTWEFDLEEANKLYTFKILCHTTSGGYCVNLFEMGIVRTSDVTPIYTATYSKGEDTDIEGIVPASVSVKSGKKITVPGNFTLYKEGYTLTAWTDGNNTYTIGQEVIVTADVILTPIFTENTVSLNERTEAVTLKWDFQRKNGAPNVAWERVSELIWVTQAVVNGKTIDVKCDFSTSPGKFANGNWDDWCQLNQGTLFSIPSCEGAEVSIEGFNALGTGDTPTTIDGQSDYTSAKTINYTITNTAETIDVVIGSEGSYYRYIQTVLPALTLTINDTETICDDFNPTYSGYAKVVYNRELNTGYKYGLICLPFAPDAESLNNFQFYTLTNADGESVTFTEIENPVAATPYLYSIKEGASTTNTITGEQTNFDLTAPTTVNNTTVGTWELVGSLKNQTIDCSADQTIANYIFNPTANTLHKITKELTVYPYTAYLRSIIAPQATASRMRVYISGPTGIKEVSRDVIEGLDEKEGIFDLQGRALSKPQKGQVYIENGEKKIKR